jgi:hypothetical protein
MKMMPTIFTGPDLKKLGIRHHQTFVGDLPIATGAFPLHVKEAVKANPLLENSFVDLVKLSQLKPRRAHGVKAPPPAPKGPPIKVQPGLKKK